ncbi:MAG: hypothetical protein E7587_03980 [Ruminococcaceae bacterium]|nr:hypothetical protein [Oscillospiraceae bacterium]
MVKIGGVSIDVSHPRAFSDVINELGLDMRYTHICKKSIFRTAEDFEWFQSKYDAKGVSAPEEMADEIDIAFIQACNWEKHLDLAMPFINKGKPVFIDKPIVGSVKDAKRIRELVANGAKIYGASAIRHAKELREFLALPESERGKVITVYGVSGCNEFDYGIHIVEAMSEVAGAKAVSNKYVGTNEVDGVKCESYAIRYENGVTGMYTTQVTKWAPFSMTVVTTTGVYSFAPNSDFYANMLTEVYNQMTKGESRLADIETIVNCCEIMICGKKSRDELGGNEVAIDELEEKDGFDGYSFEAKYAMTANPNVFKG